MNETVKPFLLEALRSRLSELGGAEPSAIGRPSISQAEAEEALRKIMVVYLPKIEKKTERTEEAEEFFRSLLRLAPLAVREDLRFLDAFNSAYEGVLEQASRFGVWWPEFLSCYGAVLNEHIARLSR